MAHFSTGRLTSLICQLTWKQQIITCDWSCLWHNVKNNSCIMYAVLQLAFSYMFDKSPISKTFTVECTSMRCYSLWFILLCPLYRGSAVFVYRGTCNLLWKFIVVVRIFLWTYKFNRSLWGCWIGHISRFYLYGASLNHSEQTESHWVCREGY